MLSIGAVERDTGIARDTLRIWERRYGFPVPQRNNKRERMYPLPQVKRLQLIKRLLDSGLRPGKVVKLSESELNRIAGDKLCNHLGQSANQVDFHDYLACIAEHNSYGLNLLLERALIRQGLNTFILKTMAPLIGLVGDHWADGKLQIYEEHFVTRQIIQFLDILMSKMPITKSGPPLLLATLPNEPHSLGLIMIECLLRNQGYLSVNFGAEVPIDQLVLAARKYQAGAIFLSFSSCYHSNSIRANILELAQHLPESISMWIGGAGVKRMRKIPEQIVIQQQLSEVLKFKLKHHSVWAS